MGGSIFRTPGSMVRTTLIFALLVVALVFHNLGGNSGDARLVRITAFGVAALVIALWGVKLPSSSTTGPRVNASNPRSPVPPGVKPGTPGWYPLAGSTTVQRHWDGTAWGQRRRWDGKKWMLE